MTEQEVNNLIDSKIGKTKMSQLPEVTQTSGLYSIGYNGNQSVKYKANLLQGDPLTVRKTYQTEALALADKNPIDTITSLPLKVGQFVSIVNDGEKNGIYRIGSISGDGTMSLELQGKLGDLSYKANHGYESNPKTLKEVEEEIVQLADDLSGYAKISINVEDENTIVEKETGNVVSRAGYYASQLLTIDGNTDLSITAYETSTGTPVALYDENMTFIRSVYTGETGVVSVVIPRDEIGEAHYCRISLREDGYLQMLSNNTYKIHGAENTATNKREIDNLKDITSRQVSNIQFQKTLNDLSSVNIESETTIVEKETGNVVSRAGYYASTPLTIDGNTDLSITAYETPNGTPVALYDENMTFIRSVYTGETGVVSVVIPRDEIGEAHYCRISLSADMLSNSSYRIYGAENTATNKREIDNLKDITSRQVSNIQFIKTLNSISEIKAGDDIDLVIRDNGHYDLNTGNFKSTPNYKSTDLFSVETAEIIFVTLSARAENVANVALFDENKNYLGYAIKGDGDTKIYDDYKFIIPDGVKYIGLSSRTDYEIRAKYASEDVELKSYTKSESDLRYKNKSSDGYGVKWDRTDFKDKGQRTGEAAGLNVVIGIGDNDGYSDFDNIYPWSEMKRCNIKENSNGVKIVTYEGEEGFAIDGSNGDVFVRIPKCSVRKFKDGDYDHIEVNSGYTHPAFIENGVELEEIFMSAFEGVMHNDKYSSVAGPIPVNNKTPQEFLDLAIANGRGYTLYDMRTMDLIYCLMAVEFGMRNSINMLGYGAGGYIQPVVARATIIDSNDNTVTVNKLTGTAKALLVKDTVITICKDYQSNIIAQRNIISSVDIDDATIITFEGDPVSITKDNCFIGSGPLQSNWIETCSNPLKWHTGMSNRDFGVRTKDLLNPNRYRWIENLTAGVWHYFPDVTFDNMQMYVCDNIDDYEMHKIDSPYRAIANPYPHQPDNGGIATDLLGVNHWITEFNIDTFGKSYLWGTSWNMEQTSKDGFGAYYYLSDYRTIIANGGGFEHAYRCNILTNRAWVADDRRWYLYGGRLLFKNLF